MENIWAPWRIIYITQKKSKKCIFCSAYKSLNDKKNFVLLRSNKCFVILNIFPYNNGHLMIAPNRHIAKFEQLDKSEIIEIYETIAKILPILKKVLKPDGFNLGINIGRAAGAGIVSHLHIHIVPRWIGDTNFMPIISGTKVISQSLSSLYDLLKNELKNNRLCNL
ncbi:MAG: HIT domain-containing protein [Candidatus Omnitrophica bacterium]|nr:HIT domain-containing protein [Candidatus Omnitrophota bacterium]